MKSLGRTLGNNIFNNVYMFSIIAKLMSVISGIMYTILLTRYLGSQLKGESALILNTATIISVILGFGVYQAYPWFKKTQSNVFKDFVDNTLGMFFINIVLVIFLVIFFEIDINIKISLILFPLLILTKQLNYIVMVENPKIRNVSSIILSTIDVLLIGALILFSDANYMLMILFLILKEVIYSLVSFKNLKLNIRTVKVKFDKIPEYVKYGLLPMLTLLLMTINYRVDILMLNGKVSISEIGIYSVGVMLAERVWIIPDALKDILISRLSNGKNETEVAKVIRLSLLLCSILILSVLLVGQTVIVWLFGNEFYNAYDITMILLFGVIGMIFYKVIYSYNVVNGHRAVNFLFLGIAAIINVLGNLLFIPLYGTKGAAFTSVASYLICGLCYVMYFKVKSKINYSEILLFKINDLKAILHILTKKG